MGIVLGGLAAAEPAQGASQCNASEEKVTACGREITVSHACDFPAVTTAMEAEALKHPELINEYERANHCVSQEATCKAHDITTGGVELDQELKKFGLGEADTPTKIRFHFSVTDTAMLKGRDDMALVSQKGFVRQMTSSYLLYWIHEHEKFHEDAGGVAEVSQKTVNQEREALLKQAAVLDEMKSEFARRKDKASEQATGAYAEIAKSRALEWEAVACELKHMAEVDYDRQGRMRSIAGGAVPGLGLGSGTSTATEASTVTGVVDTQKLADPGESGKISQPGGVGEEKKSPVAEGGAVGEVAKVSSTGASSMPGFQNPDPDNLLGAFGPDPDELAKKNQGATAPPGGQAEEGGLFERVHQQYRSRDLQGQFHQSLVD